MLEKLLKNKLLWFPEKGIGYYPVNAFPYTASYFNKYKGYADTNTGVELTKTRVSFVSKHYSGKILDIGIGCGQFVTARKETFGFDVNLKAIEWLKAKDLFIDLYQEKVLALTFWDSLEHIREPEKAIQQAKEWVFVSLPIFVDVEHIEISKHYRKNEHYWYFTHNGLIDWFNNNGFEIVDFNNDEIKLGREDIYTYAFRRKKC